MARGRTPTSGNQSLYFLPVAEVGKLTTDRVEAPTPAERRAAMTWAQRLKRVFGIDIQTCAACGGAVRIIACIEDPEVIEKILAHLDQKTTESPGRPPPCRAPPQRGLFNEPG